MFAEEINRFFRLSAILRGLSVIVLVVSVRFVRDFACIALAIVVFPSGLGPSSYLGLGKLVVQLRQQFAFHQVRYCNNNRSGVLQAIAHNLRA